MNNTVQSYLHSQKYIFEIKQIIGFVLSRYNIEKPNREAQWLCLFINIIILYFCCHPPKNTNFAPYAQNTSDTRALKTHCTLNHHHQPTHHISTLTQKKYIYQNSDIKKYARSELF